jgi:excisionase family DNA binding protein
MDGEFFSVKEFAKKLKVPISTIRNAIRAGRIHAFRPGIGKRAALRIHESEFIRIMKVSYEDILKERKKK